MRCSVSTFLFFVSLAEEASGRKEGRIPSAGMQLYYREMKGHEAMFTQRKKRGKKS